MISRFFIDRPVFASVLSILIVLLGLVSFFGLPRAQYPELAPPTVRVEALYPGANAQVIADTVASPIEQEVNGVDGMLYMSSTSSDGRYGLEVTFEVGTNVDMAAVLVQNRVTIATARLPEEVRRLGVTTTKQSTSLAGVVSLRSPDGSRDDLYLSNFLTINWRDEFARVPGVGAISILPAKEYGMRVWLDPDKLKARRLTVTDVRAAIASQNAQVAAGKIGAPPAPAGTDFELIVNTKGRLSDPAEFAEIIVKSEQGRVVRLKDVVVDDDPASGRAGVELGARDYSTISTFNRQPNAVLVVYQLPGANLVDLAGSLTRKLNELRPTLPPGTEAEFFYDASMFIKASMEEVIKTLIEAFVLVFLVVLVFLQSFRITLIPALTIPVSIVGSFLFMLALGFSVNMLTMFGLVLAIGIVVDDAIIVVENVERNMAEHGLSAREATIRAMGEITGPIIAVTLVLMSVFLPTAALGGITGQMYRQFALTIAASTGLSAVCALTLSPALCALLLKAHGQRGKGFVLFRPLRWAADAFNWVFDRITGGYVFLARWFARLAVLTIVLFGAVMYGTWWVNGRVPGGFVPDEDLGFVVVAAQLPDGASLERSQAVIDRVAAAGAGVAGIKDIVTLAGFSVLDGQASNVANAWVVLRPWDERAKTGRSVNAVMEDLRTAVAGFQEASFLVFSLPAISGVGNASGFDMRLQARNADQVSREALQQAVDATIGAAMGQRTADGRPRLLAAFSTYRAGVPQLFLDIDRERVIKMGIPLQSVFDTLQTQLGSAYVNDFNQFNRTWQVNLQADARFRLDPADILRLEVRNSAGSMVPLAAVTTVRESYGPDRVQRYNLYPAASLNGIPAPWTSSGESLAMMEQIARDTLPPGSGFEWSALSFQERRTEGQALLVFGLGLLVVYLILAAQYESFTTPLAVVISVPLVIIGALAALWMRGLDNNVFTQIGLVLLIGLGAKNAILIVEFARENRARGEGVLESAIHAARVRFRPIVMTSLAFILGVVPLLFATGAGAASRRALGTAVFGGMIGNTVLGLLFTPMLFCVITRIAEFVRPPRASHAHPGPAASAAARA
ncbi:MAG: multidrug efflux RND transporter permease subunit [Phycisphaerales bacterium]|nr:multidrug efflux RND transporter permease subunit [Phycisphaerales bacterium]